MITWETKVNGILISHIYACNIQIVEEPIYLYKYEFYNVGEKKLICGHVRHNREDGSYKLMDLIVKNAKRKIKNKECWEEE
jgi:hypothetical protein